MITIIFGEGPLKGLMSQMSVHVQLQYDRITANANNVAQLHLMYILCNLKFFHYLLRDQIFIIIHCL